MGAVFGCLSGSDVKHPAEKLQQLESARQHIVRERDSVDDHRFNQIRNGNTPGEEYEVWHQETNKIIGTTDEILKNAKDGCYISSGKELSEEMEDQLLVINNQLNNYHGLGLGSDSICKVSIGMISSSHEMKLTQRSDVTKILCIGGEGRMTWEESDKHKVARIEAERNEILPLSGIPTKHQKRHRFVQTSDEDLSNEGDSISTCNSVQVFKQGSHLGWFWNLTQFNDHDDLIAELDQIYGFGGELKGKKKWMVMYSDGVAVNLLAADSPWLEFCEVVSTISIDSLEEDQTLNQHSVTLEDIRKSTTALPVLSFVEEIVETCYFRESEEIFETHFDRESDWENEEFQ